WLASSIALAMGSGASPTLKWMSIILVISAIGIGCAAYETGNILGGALGLEDNHRHSGNILE
ncbi:hypothetical protein, partial [Serratia marcescens]|uniref:hypothetical protein n=1 Tax=Serratia marcescens TaxID=615 RepID=UPI00195362A7